MNRASIIVTLLLSFALIVFTRLQPPRDEKLNVAFTSYVHETRGLQRLELFEVKSVEVIERTSKYSLFWDFLKFPDLVVLARVPVRYGYYVDLAEPFELSVRGSKTVALAPALRAGLPAADVSGISYEVKTGSLFRNTFNAFEELRKTITPLLRENAERQIPAALEPARRQLADTIKVWCRQSSSCPEKVEVRFANEEAATASGPR